MTNWLVAIITFTFLIKVIFAADVVMPKKWYKLNALVDKEIKTIKTRGSKVGPRLQYRLVELYTEKIRLIRDQENKEFLNASNQIREKNGKDFFYRNSKNYFNLAQREGLNIIEKFPNFKSNGDIYFTLALNERDYNQSRNIVPLLRKAIRFAEAGSPIVHKAKVVLAEHHYNEKDYRKAITYYTDVLKFKRDQWYSKHLYNASWCYIKVNDNAKAIELLELAFEYSQKKNYINIEDQVYKAIGLFYVTAQRPLDAVSFYMKKAKNPHPHLLSLSDMTSKRGDIKNTESILSTAYKLAVQKKNPKQQAEVLQRRLTLFHHFKRSNEIYKTARQLLNLERKYKLVQEIKADTVDKVTNHVGFLQVELSSNAGSFEKELKEAKAKRIHKFFNLLIAFNKQDTDKYRFYQGETLYAISQHEKAAKLYIKSLEFSKKYKKKDSEFKRKILNSLFSTLAIAEMTSNKINKYHKYAYSNYLELWPKDEKSPDVYKKLFNIHMEEKRPSEAAKTFTSYNKNFPKHVDIQKGMVTLLIDHYIKVKDFTMLSEWMIKIDKGFLGFKKDYIEKGLEILASMLFEQYEKLAKEGKTKEAVQGYLALYENEKYPKIIHARSAYNNAIIYLEKGDVEESYIWLKKSLLKYNHKEILELKDKIYAISENYYLLQDFKTASHLSVKMVNHLCKEKTEVVNNFYQNSVTFELLEGDNEKALQNYNLFQKCNIDNKKRLASGKAVIAFYAKKRSYDNLLKLNTFFSQDQEIREDIIISLFDAYWDITLNDVSGDLKEIKKVLANYSALPETDGEYKTRLENIETFEKYQILFKKIDLKITQDKTKFSEEQFNQKLQTSFAKLEEFTKSGEQIIGEKHPVMTLAVYQMLGKKYDEVQSSLKAYTPQQMPKEYVSGFKQQMYGVASQLDKKGKGYTEIALKTMEKNNIFNKYGKEISGAEVFDEYRYPASKLTVPLDFNN